MVPLSGVVKELEAAIVKISGGVRHLTSRVSPGGSVGQRPRQPGVDRVEADPQEHWLAIPRRPGSLTTPSVTSHAPRFLRRGWEYEPVEFALRWDERGTPSPGSDPTSGCPAQRLFIELTTLSQKLVTHKNAKVRRSASSTRMCG